VKSIPEINLSLNIRRYFAKTFFESTGIIFDYQPQKRNFSFYIKAKVLNFLFNRYIRTDLHENCFFYVTFQAGDDAEVRQDVLHAGQGAYLHRCEDRRVVRQAIDFGRRGALPYLAEVGESQV
jgi:hypothetical protein